MYFIVIKFNKFKTALVLLLIGVVITLSVGSVNATYASVYFGGLVREIPIYCVETNEPVISFSYDAAWGADKTLELLDILEQEKIPATFFLTGIWVEEYPNMVKEIAKRGFEIGTHSQTHANMAKLNKEQIENELHTSINNINKLVDNNIELFRAPFGAYNNLLINTAKELGLKTIQWDVDSLDWKGLSALAITKRVINRVQNGSIVLFHNNADNIIDATIMLIDRLKKKGYEFDTIGNLIIKDNYYIDSRGQQRKNN